jgi:hypothetical protein
MSPQESPHTTHPLPPAVALRHLPYGYSLSQAIYPARTRMRCIGCCGCSPAWRSSPRSASGASP